MTGVSKDVEKFELLYIAVGNVLCFSHYRKKFSHSSEKLNLELPCDPAIALKISTQINTRIPCS